ncbi:MAG TPA: P-type conjugative transfer protein TrbJ [Candidatus Binataceae bacterium]|nr:P-type conjugative transfer protein TrbJ [Candidatus Binataceae bacterium]
MKTLSLRRISLASALIGIGIAVVPRPAQAVLGVGDTVFDPTMYGTQLLQLQQASSTVTNLVQQLQVMIQNTTGGSAGVWQSNQKLLTNLGELMNQQEGLAYSVNNVTQEFRQLYPGFATASTTGAQSPQSTMDTTLNTLNGALASAQAQAANFANEQATLQSLELKNRTAIGNLQAVEVSNEIALAQVQQIQLLRQLVMAQANAQNVAAASQVNTQAQSALAAQAMFSAPASPGTPDFLHAVSGAPPAP